VSAKLIEASTLGSTEKGGRGELTLGGGSDRTYSKRNWICSKIGMLAAGMCVRSPAGCLGSLTGAGGGGGGGAAFATGGCWKPAGVAGEGCEPGGGA
jgi:hypothetical protein